MKWAIGVAVTLLMSPLAFLLLFAPSEAAVGQCAENAIAATPTYTVSGEQLDYGQALVDAAPRKLTPPEAGVVFTMAAYASDLMPKSNVDPMTGQQATTSATVAISAVLTKLNMLDGWDLKPPATTAALLLEKDPGSLARAWEEAYALLYSMDPSTAALLDAVTTTGSPCGTAYGSTIDPGDLVVINGFTSPLPGSHITSGFGYRINPVTGIRKLHAGVDLAYGPTQTCNRPIVAAGDGDVVFAGASTGYGHVIMINHPNGMQTRYGHMYAQGLLVKAGDHVTTGQVIALVGSDGTSTACHLHFETRLPSGQAVNPTSVMPWLAAS